MADLAAAFDSSLFEEIPPFKAPDTRRIVGVRLRHGTRLIDCDAKGELYKIGEHLIVQTKQGTRLAEVVRPSRAFLHRGERLPGVVRRATEEDLERAARNARREADALAAGIKIVQERDLPFKLIGVEWDGEGSHATVYFCSEDKIDFKQFVYEMGARFHTRIEMRQVGIRDQAGMAGGIGNCGRELCCSSWLDGFIPISIKMAKNQGLALDNEKLAGQCGRLKCCLAYEDDTYKEASRTLPKRGFKFEMNGLRYVVVSTNVLLQKVLLQDPDRNHHLLEIDTFNALIKKPEVKCLSKVNFMDAETERRAVEMSTEVELAPMSATEEKRGMAKIQRSVADAAHQAAADMGAVLRESAPEQEEGEEPMEPAGQQAQPQGGRPQGARPQGGGDRRGGRSRGRRRRGKGRRGGGQRN